MTDSYKQFMNAVHILCEHQHCCKPGESPYARLVTFKSESPKNRVVFHFTAAYEQVPLCNSWSYPDWKDKFVRQSMNIPKGECEWLSEMKAQFVCKQCLSRAFALPKRCRRLKAEKKMNKNKKDT